VYKRLVAAAEAVREAHARVLSGRKADVPRAEATHHDAVREAVNVVRQTLDQAGETASAVVLNDIRETIQALPSDDNPGRLVRPLKPMGFAALLRMMPGGVPDETERRRARLVEAPKPDAPLAAPRREGDAVSKRAKAEADRTAIEQAKREEHERKRQLASLDRELREARAAEREYAAAVEDARDQLKRAEREEQRRQAAVEEQRFEVRRLAGDVTAREQRARAATEARARLERARADLDRS
jgi:hypothetical protein